MMMHTRRHVGKSTSMSSSDFVKLLCSNIRFLGRLRSVLQSSLLQFALSDSLCVGTELLLDAFDSVMFFDSAKQFVEVC